MCVDLNTFHIFKIEDLQDEYSKKIKLRDGKFVVLMPKILFQFGALTQEHLIYPSPWQHNSLKQQKNSYK